jgi:hypothetical protein
MKRLKLSFAIGILTIAFAVSTAMAGQMPTGVTPPPPPPPQESVTGDLPMGVTSTSTSPDGSVTGEMPFGVTPEVDPVMEFTLGLLQSVLAFF